MVPLGRFRRWALCLHRRSVESFHRHDCSHHIVCFGDSLTAGFQSPTADTPQGAETPYGQFLQELTGPSVRVSVSGICGELTGEMAMRFRRGVLQQQPSHVVLLGGTNDLGWNAEPAEIRGSGESMNGRLTGRAGPFYVTFH